MHAVRLLLMLRRLFTLASALSLLLFATTAALWVLSFRGCTGLSVVDDTDPGDAHWRDFFVYRGKAGTLTAGYDAGMSNVDSFETRGRHRQWRFVGKPPWLVENAVGFAEEGMVDWQFAGISTAESHGGYWQILVPFWFVPVTFAPLPAWWALAMIRGRARRSRCRKCGYDLRATPDRCPECGSAVRKEPTGRLSGA